MPKGVPTTIDGIEAVAYTAYRINEVIAIYPITPASGMGEWADAWASEGIPNIWGTVPNVAEMQSEAGAAGAVHGSLQGGALTTTFTASQGLLLKIPNMYKIAGELTPTVFNVAARTVATHALSIFGDHSDVMAARATGFALMPSGSVQEATDLALIAQAASLRSRVPFLHFFDGFRTSHEVQKIELLSEDVMRAMIDYKLVAEHRARALSPDRPFIRGTAQNPDVFFQARETVNPFYLACPEITREVMDRFAELTGRRYRLFDYFGHPEAERVIVIMGSGAEVVHETVDHMVAAGEKVGVVKVRLYRPFDVPSFLEALPPTVKAIAAMDRTKEPGAVGEPLYMDCVTAVEEGMAGDRGTLQSRPRVVGGRYGLSSKEFTPAMIKAVFDNLSGAKPKNRFTVGIEDDVTHSSLPFDPEFSTEPKEVVRALFYGLGSDGTVGANKNSIKIIGEGTDNYAQGYFVYDSKKAGAVTVSHLRFGPKPIRSSYLVTKASFVACHQTVFLERYDMLRNLIPGGVFLLNCPWGPDEVWDHLPREVQEGLIAKKARFYVIDAYQVAGDSGMGGRINTVMQVCFFAISGVLPREEAIQAIKDSIKKTYGKKGEEVVKMNFAAVDNSIAHLHEVKYPEKATSGTRMPPPVPPEAPEFVRKVTAEILAGRGDSVPVSAFPADGTFPSGTTRWEKRNIALEIPVWDPETCIQCGKCSAICPHATIRMKVYDPKLLKGAPATFRSTEPRDKAWKEKGYVFTLQIAPEDCTGCGLCVEACPAKNKTETARKAINMAAQPPLRETERENWEFFLGLPDPDRREIRADLLRQQQLQLPLFEFSGACAGCGETPYLKMMSQLFGDRALIANATGCSSIYGGNLPTTPYSVNADGRGPAWSNSLFEDNAEFGLGFRLAVDKQKQYAAELLKKLAGDVGEGLVKEILGAQQQTEIDIMAQRERVERLKKALAAKDSEDARRLLGMADLLVRKSVWIIGGDGWAYDIGFGGLDHVFAMGRDVNILVLDTEVYSNTGGQCSKSTPRGAVAKYAAAGKPAPKKDLGLIAMTYGTVYVARIAMGANDGQALKAFLEADAFPGTSLILAYSHCIAHGIDMSTATRNQKMAVDTGQWPLFRFHPGREAAGENPLQLDSKPPKVPVSEFMEMENRFRMLKKSKPENAKRFLAEAQQDVNTRWAYYQYLADRGKDSAKGK
ncbi:MAG: pyruvate:ferredoxin (flavodoxin) oxidoreductase [Candidatus Eisenbacteria bacterium]|nr:pyruvate:ferredoxin (flavodoxin) oxidoreductase [Candidatus Eisenbacteria bacterium]